MPFHLPPLSRRAFFARSLTAGAGLLTIPPMSGAEADPDRWALLSDTHIAADPAAMSRSVNMAEHLRAALSEVQALSVAPAGIFVNGDCAMTKGLAEDYGTFSALFAPIRESGLPIHITLGNHDDRDVFWSEIQNARPSAPPLASKHVSVVEGARANWFLLDSLDIVNETPGRLGAEQLDWLAKALDARPEKPALVMVHHNPVPSAPGKHAGLLDSDGLFAVLLPRRQAKAVFFGHTHTWRVTAHQDLRLVNLPAVAYPFAPDAVTGWIDLKLSGTGAALEVRAFDDKHPAHGTVTNLNWRAS